MAKLESTAATSVVEASSNLAVVIEKRQEKLILPEFCLIAPGWRETILPTCHTDGREAAEKRSIRCLDWLYAAYGKYSPSEFMRHLGKMTPLRLWPLLWVLRSLHLRI